MKKHLIFLVVLLISSSCLNYIPCRGQDYIIEDITHQELIEKFNDFREKHPEYKSDPDYINEHVPHYYIELYWKDLDLEIHCDIHIGDQIPNHPTHLNFLLVRDSTEEYKDINSKELEKEQNEEYKTKFETEILDVLGVKWKRKSCW